jgi:hypothetical protein
MLAKITSTFSASFISCTNLYNKSEDDINAETNREKLIKFSVMANSKPNNKKRYNISATGIPAFCLLLAE